LAPGEAVKAEREAMDPDRRMRLWALVLAQARDEPVVVGHVCAAMVIATEVTGATVTVLLDSAQRETVYASDHTAGQLAELALTMGEGPGVDACADAVPVLVADLAAADELARWPMFAPAAVLAGARAVLALPLHVGAIQLGVLEAYRGTPGALDDGQLADALALADTACALLLDSADHPAAGHDLPERASGSHPEVHQATGMITVQLGVTMAVALIRLRAYAYANDRRLYEVAADVVARRLRFDPDAIGG
jgi:hypothetical protein